MMNRRISGICLLYDMSVIAPCSKITKGFIGKGFTYPSFIFGQPAVLAKFFDTVGERAFVFIIAIVIEFIVFT